jgi:hypothetical protein
LGLDFDFARDWGGWRLSEELDTLGDLILDKEAPENVLLALGVQVLDLLEPVVVAEQIMLPVELHFGENLDFGLEH